MREETPKMATEIRRDIESMAEIERLFRELERTRDDESRRMIVNEIRIRLKDYRREFGKEAAQPYYERMERLKKAA